MNDSLDKLFYEKNKEILKNKLILDINNNTDSLELTLSNVISLEMNKLYKNLIRVCEENKLEYSIQELKELIEKEKSSLNSILLDELSKRRVVLEDYVKEGDS